MMYDIIIKDGNIIDGTGEESYQADVGIKGNKIINIGNLGDDAEKVIDAEGLIISPGFIDVHTHYEFGIFRKEIDEHLIRQGITTVIGGNCGESPLDIGEHFRRVEGKGIAFNYSLLFGHTTLRKEVMGMSPDKPDPEQMEEMKSLVRKAMREGALGLSTGLRYVPAHYADTEEIIELCRVVIECGGLHASHRRSEETETVEATREVIEVSRRTGIPLQISHLKTAWRANWSKNKELLDLIDKSLSEGIDISADAYPYDSGKAILTQLFPYWVFENEAMRRNLTDPESRKQVKIELDELFRDFIPPEDIMIFSDVKPDIFGKSLAQISEDWGILPREAAIELALLGGEMLGTGIPSIFRGIMSEDNIKAILSKPYVMIGSDADIAEGKPLESAHPRTFGTFARMIARYVREEKMLTLEEAIRKMTYLPAKRFKFEGRGVIKEGAIADLVIFDLAEIKDSATYEDPVNYPEGIEYVLVNGVLSLDRVEYNGAKAGQIIRSVLP